MIRQVLNDQKKKKHFMEDLHHAFFRVNLLKIEPRLCIVKLQLMEFQHFNSGGE